MSADTLLVGIDFTASTLRLRLAQTDGTVVKSIEHALPELGTEEEWSWEVGGRIATLFAAEGHRLSALAIGIAAPGPVDPVSGRLLRAGDGQEAWEGLAMVDALRRHIDVPVVAVNRVAAGLTAERWAGAAQGVDNAVYVSLRGVPAAAILVDGHIVRGESNEAGALPAVPQFEPGARLAGRDLEAAAGLLADAVALLDPELVIVEAADEHAEPLLPLLQRVIDEVAPGPRVVRAELGVHGPLVGAVGAASTAAFEGEREG
jgi:predicted NBD/HSP70 family sugar kinase